MIDNFTVIFARDKSKDHAKLAIIIKSTLSNFSKEIKNVRTSSVNMTTLSLLITQTQWTFTLQRSVYLIQSLQQMFRLDNDMRLFN